MHISLLLYNYNLNFFLVVLNVFGTRDYKDLVWTEMAKNPVHLNSKLYPTPRLYKVANFSGFGN